MPTMPLRNIGPFSVSAIGLGCMNLHHAYGKGPGDAEGAKLLNAALDDGVNFLDTAAVYGLGKNERLIGQAVMHRRQEFILASKCVFDFRDGRRIVDGRPGSIARTLDEALQRLRTDYIDLYYMHRLDRDVPIEDSVGALARAVEAGKIRAIGLSEMSGATIRRAHAVHPIAAVQNEYSPWVRNSEISVLATCRELGIGFVAFSPVGRGFFAGSVRAPQFEEGDIRADWPRFMAGNLEHNLVLLDQFNAVAKRIGITPAQLALAWVLAQDPHIVAIPGTRQIARVLENNAAAHVQLSPEDIAAVDAIFTPGAVHGHRYPPHMQVYVDTELMPEEMTAA